MLFQYVSDMSSSLPKLCQLCVVEFCVGLLSWSHFHSIPMSIFPLPSCSRPVSVSAVLDAVRFLQVSVSVTAFLHTNEISNCNFLPLTHEPYMPLLSSRKASPPFGWYSLRLPTKGWPGWVGLGGWLHTEINVPHQGNWTRTRSPIQVQACRRLTSLIKTNTLPPCQTTTNSMVVMHL